MKEEQESLTRLSVSVCAGLGGVHDPDAGVRGQHFAAHRLHGLLEALLRSQDLEPSILRSSERGRDACPVPTTVSFRRPSKRAEG